MDYLDITPTWPAMIENLVGMIGAADENTTPEVYDWAWQQLQRIGEHLDSLPDNHKLPMVTPAEYFKAKRVLLGA